MPQEDEEDDDEDPEEDPVDYPADGGDDGDDADESSEDDEDDDIDIEAPSAEEIEPFKTDESAATPPPHPAYRVTARISIPALAISTPPSSPLSLWSSTLPQIPFPPLPSIPSPSLPLLPPVPVSSPALPTSPIRLLGYRVAMIRMRAEAASTSQSLPLPPPLPISAHTSSPPLLLPSTSHREDRPEVTLPPRKRLGIALGPRYEVGESSSVATARPAGGLRADYGFISTLDDEIRRDPERYVGYGIIDTWDDMVEDLQGTPVATDVAELDWRMTGFETRVRQDTNEIYTSRKILELPDADRRGRTATSEMLKADHKRHVEMRELRIANRTRQEQLIQTLTLMQSLQRQAMIDQGVTAALAARDANRNCDDSHTSGTSVRRIERVARECTYQDFMKYQPLYFKGTEGVVELTQ
ncbi:hypothetical protein Tco_1008830, partial [Tanacetum coccineum]